MGPSTDGETPAATGDDGWSFATVPDHEVEVPAVVATVAGGVDVRCVWRNQLGGLTFEIGDGTRFLKWSPAGVAVRAHNEIERLRWVQPYTPVPEILDAGTADDGSTWLLTARVPGTNAVADRWKASPTVAVRAIGEGLRAFHDLVPVARCPFDWSADERLTRVRRRAEADAINSSAWHPSHRTLTVDEALALVADPPPIDRLVVCHGDACAPNTLIADDGSWSGHVDLGSMGTGDQWADIAIATWSTQWNYGPGWEHELLAAYGAQPDPDRTRYYRLLWDLLD